MSLDCYFYLQDLLCERQTYRETVKKNVYSYALSPTEYGGA